MSEPSLAQTQTVSTQTLAPGVQVFEYHAKSVPQPNVVHVAAIGKSAAVNFKVVTTGKRELASQLCQQYHCLVGVNGGFFDRDRPIPGGNPVARSILGFDIPGIGPGAVVLVDNGKVHAIPPDGRFTDVRHPRTIACSKADGSRLLVEVDGRQPGSLGVDLNDAAKLSHELGCMRAINFDGGGSSTFVVKGQIVNRPSNALVKSSGGLKLVESMLRTGPIIKGYLPRPVYNAVVVVPKPSAPKVLAVTATPKSRPMVNALIGGVVVRLNLPTTERPVSHRRNSPGLKRWAILSLIGGYVAPLTLQRKTRRKPAGRLSSPASAFWWLSHSSGFTAFSAYL